MNQILVTQKLYITPELKRKKKIYKFEFLLSIFLVCVLFSLYIYAAYDRNKSEEVSQDLLAGIDFNVEDDETVGNVSNDVLTVVLDDIHEREIEESKTEESIVIPQTEYEAPNGEKYTIIGVINIPKINVNYPVLSITSDALLKISPCKFWGPEPNEVGNLCIVGHNYRNSKFFSKVPTLEVGDIIELTDMYGKLIKYEVYDKYTVEPTDVACTSQLTKGKKEVTLITCTNDSKQRVIVKTREVK